jgi:hypothetical protein
MNQALESSMISDKFVWLAASSSLLVSWVGLFGCFRYYRRPMVWVSALTMPLGLSEAIFVPAYWNPPSLFDLAKTTGLDVESFIFCFSIGGVGAVLYHIVCDHTLTPLGVVSREQRRDPYHRPAMVVPAAAFAMLYFLPWNPIYSAISAMVFGSIIILVYRGDLRDKVFISGGLFVVYYAFFLLLLDWLSPDYIGRVWNLSMLSGATIAGIPLEELLFAFAFGAYWSGIFDPLTWPANRRTDSSQFPKVIWLPTWREAFMRRERDGR